MKNNVNIDSLIEKRYIKDIEIAHPFGFEKLEGNYSFVNCTFYENVFIDEVNGNIEFINCNFKQGFSTGLLWVSGNLTFIKNNFSEMIHLLCHVTGNCQIIQNNFVDSFYLSDSVFEKELVISRNKVLGNTDFFNINSGISGSAEVLGYLNISDNQVKRKI